MSRYLAGEVFGNSGSGCLGEGNGEAECLQLADVAAGGLDHPPFLGRMVPRCVQGR
jgi:hypothetical protein